MRIRGYVVRIWAVAKKDMRIYYLKGPVVIFGMLIPAFLYLAYAVGRNITPQQAIPGIMSMTVFFTSTSVGPVIMPWEARSRTLERLLSSPVNMPMILLGDAAASAIFAVALTTAVSLVGLSFKVCTFRLAILAFNLVASALCYSFLGLAMSAYPSDVPATVMMLSSLVKFPMVFISGIFIPIEAMPTPLKMLSLLSPLTYTTELFRASVGLNVQVAPRFAALILAAYTAAVTYVTMRLHKATLPRRFQ